MRLAVTLAFAALPALAADHPPIDPMYKWINFGILFVVLAWMIAKNVPPLLNARRQEIHHAIEDAKKVRADAEARAASIEARLNSLDAELSSLREEGRKEMAAEQARIEEETRRLATRLDEHAAREIRSLEKQALDELRAHASRLALELAEQKIKGRMNPEAQAILVGRFVANLRQAGSVN
jgi:F-type H+-transporting ATPase subunit b